MQALHALFQLLHVLLLAGARVPENVAFFHFGRFAGVDRSAVKDRKETKRKQQEVSDV